MARVSVVIPTYNYAHYLNEAIQSVLDQTFTDFELIIVDDGSTDNTHAVVRGFKDPRIRYIYQENRGVAAAQNTGIKAACGEYITVLGSDDMYLPQNLEQKVKVLDARPEIDLVCSDIYIFDDKTGAILSRSWHGGSLNHLFNPQRAARRPLEEILSRGCFIVPQATMLRRRVFTEIGYFDESLRFGEDFDLFVRIVQRFSIETIDIPLVKFRRHDDSMTAGWESWYQKDVIIANRALQKYSLSSDNVKRIKERLARHHLLYGRHAVVNGQISEGRQALIAGIKARALCLKPYVYLTLSLLGSRGILFIKFFKKLLENSFFQSQPSGNVQANSVGIECLNDENIGAEQSGSMPKVSVIIPVYNYGRYLGEAIQSVLDQTYTNFELIIVDDGSTDDSSEVVKRYQDPRIRYIYQENRGVSSAQNTGIEASSGEYVAFLGADDLYLPENLEIKVKLLESRPGIGLVCSDIFHFDNSTGVILGRLWHDVSAHYRLDPATVAQQPLKHIISWGCFIWPQSVLIRRQVFTEVGIFDESFTTCEDWDLFIRIVQRFPISVIDKPLAKIRRHNVSLMANENKMYHGEVATLNKLLRSGTLSKNHVKLVKSKLAPMYLHRGRQAVRGGDTVEGKKALLNCIKIKPLTFKAYILLALSIMGTKRITNVRCLKIRLGQILGRHHTRENTQSIAG